MNEPRRLKDLATSDTGFVFDPFSGATFTVNASGLATLRGLQDGLDEDGIARRLREEFEIPPGADVGREIDEFVLLLRQQGLIA